LRDLQGRRIKEQPQSPLLRLPAELRNRIYEYALTAKGDLMYMFWGTDHKSIICDSAHDADSSRPVSVGATEFNQLKYVCLKLYAETAAIELKLNALNVHGQYDLPVTRPAYGFSCFVQQLSPSKHAWLAHVVLELTASNWPKNDLSRLLMEGPSSFIEIAKFCVKNPQIKVDYIVRAFSTHVNAPKHAIFQSILFLRQGFWATWFFRRKDLRPMAHAVYFDRFDRFFELFTMENNGEPIVLPNAPNLRIRPADKVLSPNLALWLHMVVSDGALTPEQSRLCLELAEDWVKNGI
jgi:hypothetical protein